MLACLQPHSWEVLEPELEHRSGGFQSSFHTISTTPIQAKGNHPLRQAM